MAADGWAVTFGTARRGLQPTQALPNVTAHPSTASVPIAALLYNSSLLSGFNVFIIGLIRRKTSADVLSGRVGPDSVEWSLTYRDKTR